MLVGMSRRTVSSMARRTGWAAIAFSAGFLVALAACGIGGDSASGGGSSEAVNSERQTIRVSRRNGQTGLQGSCQRVPDPQPFSADDMRALIEGTHTTTLAYRAASLPPGSDTVGLPMTVRVELQGEPRIGRTEQNESCNFRIDQDVEVTASLDEPALDVVIATTVSAFSSTFATMQEQLGSDVAAALGLPPSDIITFTLTFDESGMRGTFEPHDECGRAVFPANVRCPDWSTVDVELSLERHGVRPIELLSVLDELSEVPLTWGDGTQTTLAVSLVKTPEWACSGNFVETFCPENLQMAVTVRAVTADGRLDAEFPASVSLNVATEGSAMDGTCGMVRTAGEIESISLSASYFGDAAGEPGPGIIPPLEANTGLWLRVSVAPASSEGAMAEIRTLELERQDAGLTPPLDATIDPAGGSCISAVFAEEVDSKGP